MNLIDIKEKEPPKTEPFLALTVRGFEMMEWVERIEFDKSKGWYGFYRPCACCSGFCSTAFNYWMPLPEIPQRSW